MIGAMNFMYDSRQPWLAALIVAFVCAVATIAGAEEVVHSWSGKTMGPIGYTVKIVAGRQIDVEPIQAEVTAVLESVNSRMSTYQPESEISRFNRSESTDWFSVSSATAAVVQRSIEISEITDGAFDITVKPIVERWNFGAGKKENFVPPTPEETRSLLERIGYRKLAVQLEPPALRKSEPRLQIDLSAIAKGYAVDLVSAKLTELGFPAHFVEIGGEVRAHGSKPNGQPWVVAIEKPTVGVRQMDRTAAIRDVAIATSGDYRNFVEVAGRRRSHTIDPRTGEPIENHVASVSVVAADCMTADALATALMVLGPTAAARLAEEQQVSVFVIKLDGGERSETIAGDFPFYEVEGADTVEDRPTIWPALIAAFVLFGLAVLGMAIGAIFSRRPIQGSCGGIAGTTNPDGSTRCSLCQNPGQDCREKQTGEPSRR